jgi:hypothetical protein
MVDGSQPDSKAVADAELTIASVAVTNNVRKTTDPKTLSDVTIATPLDS